MTLDKAANLGRTLGKMSNQQEEVIKSNMSADEANAQLMVGNTESITIEEDFIVRKKVPDADAIRFDISWAFAFDSTSYSFDSFYNELLTETLFIY